MVLFRLLLSPLIYLISLMWIIMFIGPMYFIGGLYLFIITLLGLQNKHDSEYESLVESFKMLTILI